MTRHAWANVGLAPQVRVFLSLMGLALVLALSLSAASAPTPQKESFDELIDREMPPSAAPGMSYAVVADGHLTAAGSRGVTVLGNNTLITPDTPFMIGSISKSFTALAIMQLVEANEIDLDVRLSRYLHEFSGQASGEITIRQLLSHASGFSTIQGNATRANTSGGIDDLARAVRDLAEQTPSYEPGEVWEYSNANYQILGRLIEVVSGQDYQSYVTDRILKPLGMSHSFVADGGFHPSMARGHRPWFSTKRPINEVTTDRATAPQGGIIASVSDLARYLIVMMNGEDDVLSAEGKAMMMRPASEVSPNYAFGWRLDPASGAVWHDGVSPGVESLAVMRPTENRAAIVLVNGGSGFGFGETGPLRVGITNLALGLEWDTGANGWSRKAFFIFLVALPFIYLLGILKTWSDRIKIRAKSGSGAVGLISLWFPLFATGAAAWVLIELIPRLYGTPITALQYFVPDFVLALVVSAVTGLVLTAFRVLVAYTGKARPT